MDTVAKCQPETNMHVQGNWYTCTVYGFTMTQIVYYSKGESQKEIPMTKVFKTIAIKDGDAPFPEDLNYHVVRVSVDGVDLLRKTSEGFKVKDGGGGGGGGGGGESHTQMHLI